MKKPELQIDKFENKFWYFNSKLHRDDGPACEFANGDKFWYFNDKKHRIDGPAMESSSGDEYWFLNGKEVNKEDVIINAILTEKEYIEFILKRLL